MKVLLVSNWKKVFFNFYDTMSEVCQGYSHNQIDRIVSESLSYIATVLLRKANLWSKVELKYIIPL